jgi:hypothetical protein
MRIGCVQNSYKDRNKLPFFLKIGMTVRNTIKTTISIQESTKLPLNYISDRVYATCMDIRSIIMMLNCNAQE